MCKETWFLIVNPTSGSFSAKRKWKQITAAFEANELPFVFEFTTKPQHEAELVLQALKKGYRKLVSVGGDGTLHHIVNSLLRQTDVSLNAIKLAVIPLGTGNDWVKTYQIPKRIPEAVQLIKEGYTIFQDIGQITLLPTGKIVFFNNMAGIGFDGYVVQQNERLKFLGAASFFISAVLGLIRYKPTELTINLPAKKMTTKSLLTVVGIGQFSGGGMQLTNYGDATDGWFDVSVAKNFTFWQLIRNLPKLFNGTIVNHPQVEIFQTKEIMIQSSKVGTFIQADGELVGTGGFSAKILPKTLCFVVPKR